MLKIRNNDIYVNRGETHALTFRVWNEDGSPFILPQLVGAKKSLANIARYIVSDNNERYDFYSPIIAHSIGDNPSSYTITIDKATGTVEVHCMGGSGYNTIKVLSITNHSIQLDFEPGVENTIVALEAKDCKITSFAVNNEVYYGIDDADIMTSVLAFTVRSSEYDDIALTKYLNLHTAIVQDGYTDYMAYGWNKFTTRDVVAADSTDDLRTILLDKLAQGIVQVGRVGVNYYCLAARANAYELVPYEFCVVIPFEYVDTADLAAKEYTYDVIAYQGHISDLSVFAENIFPFDKIVWKKEIVQPHKYIIGDSYNA